MSVNRRRPRWTTTKERNQRRAASERANKKRTTAKILAQLDELKRNVIKLEENNVPPVRFPVGTSSSVIDIDNPRSNEGDEDPAINRFLDTLDVELQVRNKQAYNLWCRGGGKA